MFEDGISGLHYPAGDSTALAERLERLVYDPELLLRLQKAGEQRVRGNFSVNAAVRQLESLLRTFDAMKPAVITPITKKISRSLNVATAVCSQTARVTHIMVADGSSRAVIDQWDGQHLVLPQGHRNCGNTPRG